jgi:hypothetical protein
MLKDLLRPYVHYYRLPAEAKREHDEDGRNIAGEDPGPETANAAAIDWLCAAQDNSRTNDGGVARDYSLISGWNSSYPETTGYIIPTVLAYGIKHGRQDLVDRSRRMLDWLVAIQLPEGGFQGGMVDQTPVVGVTFNTGQILMGLAAGARDFKEEAYVRSLHRAARWMVETQDPDGCWRKNLKPFCDGGEEKTYEVHAAWGLLEAFRVTGVQEYLDAAMKNVYWAVNLQQANGWFAQTCIDDSTRPLTHTIGYVLRGVIEACLAVKDEALLHSTKKLASALVSATRADGMLPGQFYSDWTPAADYVCMTGSVQIAYCWMVLYELTGEERYLDTARLVNSYVRRRVDYHGRPEIRGGVKGSYPVFGEYGKYEYLNWAAKFFIDSNEKEMALRGQ